MGVDTLRQLMEIQSSLTIRVNEVPTKARHIAWLKPLFEAGDGEYIYPGYHTHLRRVNNEMGSVQL